MYSVSMLSSKSWDNVLSSGTVLCQRGAVSVICTVVLGSAGVVLGCVEATVPSAEGLDIVVTVPVGSTGVLAYGVSENGVWSSIVIVWTVLVVGSVESLQVRWGGGMIRRLVR